MEVDKIRKTFKLIEPFLPEKVVSDFEHFIDEAVEVKQMYRYNSQMHEMLQDSIQVLSEKLERKEREEQQQKKENIQLIEELDQALQQKYELEKQYQDANKQRSYFQNKTQETENLLKEEKENFQLLLDKAVKENEKLHLALQELNKRLKQSVPRSIYQKEVAALKQEIKEKEQELDWLAKESEELQMEYEAYKERSSYAYQNGFQKAILYERKRKR